MRRALVTGGSGFIGSSLVRRLVRDGHAVRVLDDGSRGPLRRLDDIRQEVDVVVGDVRDPRVVSDACRDIEEVYHLAAINGTAFFYSMPERVLDVGIRGTLNVIDAARQHGVARLFLASTSEVYQTPPRIPTSEDVPMSIPDPHNPRYSYAASKIASELLVLNHGRTAFEKVVVFRPHNVYGPDMGWEHVIPQLAMRIRDLARSGGPSIRVAVEGTGEETRAFSFIDDSVAGIVIAAERGEHLGIYNVGTDTETSIASLASAIGRYFGCAVSVEPGDAPAGATPRRCPDISRLRALGYEPRVDLEHGLAVTLRWYDEHAELQPDRMAVHG